MNIRITPLCVGLLKQKSGRKFFILSSQISFEKEMKTVYIININYMNIILFLSVHSCQYLTYNPANALKYVNVALFTLLHSHIFQPKKAILREYWYISWSGSIKYLSRYHI
jgi:hypothetical protein